MANGQTGFKPPRAQFQRGGQTAMAGTPQMTVHPGLMPGMPYAPNPNAAPPPGPVDINAKNRVPPGLMRFLNPGLMPGAMGPQGMRPGQPPPQMNAFERGAPGGLTQQAQVGLQDPNAVAPVGLPQFAVGQPPGGIPMRQPVAMGGSFLGAPGRGPLVAEGPMPAPVGGIPAGQGGIPRSLLNLAMRRTGFMPQAFGQFGP